MRDAGLAEAGTYGRPPRRSPIERSSRRAPLLAQRPTEFDVRDALESRMRALGADGPSYATIVASGPRFAAVPHHETGRLTIVEGDTVIINVGLGLPVYGYHSDMTRSFVVGDPTPRAARRVRPCVREAQAAGLATVLRRRSGPPTSTPRAGRCSVPPGARTGTSTAPATVSASTSTRSPSRPPVSTADAARGGRGDRGARPLS